MGIRFMQERETIHTAIELIDRYYLIMSKEVPLKEFRRQFMHPRQAILHQVTCLLIASKLVEIDDNIVKIEKLRTYVIK